MLSMHFEKVSLCDIERTLCMKLSIYRNQLPYVGAGVCLVFISECICEYLAGGLVYFGFKG